MFVITGLDVLLPCYGNDMHDLCLAGIYFCGFASDPFWKEREKVFARVSNW